MPDINFLLSKIPQEQGLREHVFRVAALVSRSAKLIGYSADQAGSVETAALLHHLPVALPPDPMVTRLFTDLGFASELAAHNLPHQEVPEDVAEILTAFRGSASRSEFANSAAALLESANLFDEQMENLPYENVGVQAAVQDLIDSGVLCRAFVSALASFRTLSPESLSDTVRALPVFPTAAMEALRLARNPDVSLRKLETVVSRDAVLAGEIIKLANSAAMESSYPTRSVGGALARIGLLAAEKLIVTAAFRPFFVSSQVHRLWVHALETAEAAEQIGRESGMEPAEAYLAGLVHDVGRLAFELSPAAIEIQRWLESGFPANYAEFLIAGTDHSAVGADIVKSWLFPESLVEAVRHHHRPELSSDRLSAAIYLVEDEEEMLPSLARENLVAKRLDRDKIQQQSRAAG